LHPQPVGWNWDIAAGGFATRDNGGIQGSCQEVIIAESAEDALKYQMYLGHDRTGIFGKNHDGYQACVVGGPAYQMVDRAEAIPAQQGTLSWLSDVSITLPNDAGAFQLKVTTFDGRERIYTNTGGDTFYSVNKAGNRLIRSPMVPTTVP
jgi:hypothetical protein